MANKEEEKRPVFILVSFFFFLIKIKKVETNETTTAHIKKLNLLLNK